jgi:twitching motility protein PilT
MKSSAQLSVAELNAALFGTSTTRAVPTDTIITTMLDCGSGISDLIFSPGRPPQVERYGELVEVKIDGLPALRHDDTAGVACDLIRNNETVLRTLLESGSTDLSYMLPERCRFRVNVFRQRGTFAIVMRVIASKIPSVEELGLPPAIKDCATLKNGIVLVTGPTGSGKSSTLAAIIDLINTTRAEHILTIEDPIEFVHPRKNCLISQREIGNHSPSFASALHSALREDPDVILVGELRDYETISIAVTAAEMGILVMGTLHTNGAAHTVDRMINVFPADKQSHVRTMLSTSLRGVISQQLLQKADKSGRVAALEILVNTPAVSNLIRQGKLDQLETTMQSGSQFGMRTMDNAIEALLNQRIITGKEAYKKGISKAKFEPVKDQG